MLLSFYFASIFCLHTALVHLPEKIYHLILSIKSKNNYFYPININILFPKRLQKINAMNCTSPPY